MSATRAAGRREPSTEEAPAARPASRSRTSRTSTRTSSRTTRTPDRGRTSRPPGRHGPGPTVTAPEPQPGPAEGGSTDELVAGRRTRRTRSQGPNVLRSPRNRLLLACTAALAAGLVVVLMLNTVISQGAFRQHDLEIQLILLAEREESLARSVQQAESPIEVERAARKLGMVPAAAPVFLRLADGKILGEPVPAPAPTGRVGFAGAPGIQPTPRPTPSPTPSGSLAATGIDRALDPATGRDQVSSGVDPAAEPADAASSAPEASPAPAPTQQESTP
jgi:hypothetical protein